MNTYDIIKWVESRTHGIVHGNRTFIHHLFGTYDILRSWGEDLSLCHAGLCHALYETAYFKNEKMRNRIPRQLLADLIGAEAEYLVYLFCNMPDRAMDLKNNKFNFPPELYVQLLKIELANFVEQMDDFSEWTEEQKQNVIRQTLDLIKSHDVNFEPKGIMI